MLFCDNWFHAVFIRQSSGREIKILEISKKLKRTVKIMFTLELHISLCVCGLYLCIVMYCHICDVSVCVCVCVFVCVCVCACV